MFNVDQNLMISTKIMDLIVIFFNFQNMWFRYRIFQLINAFVFLRVRYFYWTNLILRKSIFFVYINKNFQIKRICDFKDLNFIDWVKIRKARDNFFDLRRILNWTDKNTIFRNTFDFEPNLTFSQLIFLVFHQWIWKIIFLID